MSNIAAEKSLADLTANELIQLSIEENEGVYSSTGAIAVLTGKRTGRSPKDRFIVEDNVTSSHIDWGDVNRPVSQKTFLALWKKASDYLQGKRVYQSDLQIGADLTYALPVKVITELAWHNVFCRNLFISPCSKGLVDKPQWTLMNAAGLTTSPEVDGTHSDGVVMINITERKVLLCGMLYAGEMKKAMFTILNYLLPEKRVLPMHCASNVGEAGDVALFFGLSGTGKTTLSADPNRYLIGDDEHGWSSEGVFNFEGGCYAKCIDLSEEREPVIWNAIRSGAIIENVVLNSAGIADYSDDKYTRNSRVAYPRTHIEKRVEANKAELPQAVIFLCCDLFGVLPPVALLTKEQAAYYFLSGYTALVGSTEVGSTAGIQPTFSTCFGAPFFPRPATVYADLLMEKIVECNSPVYLVNTGWTGGAYGAGGERFAIPFTRKIVKAAIDGSLLTVEKERYPGFDFDIPVAVSGVDLAVLNPKNCWQDQQAYQENMNKLIELFKENFVRFDVSTSISSVGPEAI